YNRFLFQAEDGIRGRNVTGVQTCALPIYNGKPHLTLLVNNGYCTRDRFSIRGGQHAMAQVPNMPSGMSCCLRRCHLLANGTYRPADGIIASEKHCRMQVTLQSVCNVPDRK